MTARRGYSKTTPIKCDNSSQPIPCLTVNKTSPNTTGWPISAPMPSLSGADQRIWQNKNKKYIYNYLPSLVFQNKHICSTLGNFFFILFSFFDSWQLICERMQHISKNTSTQRADSNLHFFSLFTTCWYSKYPKAKIESLFTVSHLFLKMSPRKTVIVNPQTMQKKKKS